MDEQTWQKMGTEILISPEIQGLAETEELGEFRKVYTISTGNRFEKFVVA